MSMCAPLAPQPRPLAAGIKGLPHRVYLGAKPTVRFSPFLLQENAQSYSSRQRRTDRDRLSRYISLAGYSSYFPLVVATAHSVIRLLLIDGVSHGEPAIKCLAPPEVSLLVP